MVNAPHPLLPNGRQPGRSLPARTPALSHQASANVDPHRIRVGHAVQLDGYTFVWDGSQFRSARREQAAWTEYRRWGRALLMRVLLGVIMAWTVVYGLEWEAMTWDQRAPYMWAGGSALLILLVCLWGFARDFPRRQARETDRWLKNHLGITQGER